MVKPGAMRRWRQFALLKQGVFAEELGLSQPLISRYEIGDHPMPKARVELVVKLINAALEAGGVDARCRIEDIVEGGRYLAKGCKGELE